MRRFAPQLCVCAWVLLALLWFAPLGVPTLFDPDEGRYGEIPREMLVSGDWVTPRLDGVKYFEKPPLQYWATAVTEELVGPNAWAVRLWPALCGFAGLLLARAVGRRLYGERAGWCSLIVQGSALYYVGLARVATLDMALSFSLQIALSALVLLVHRPASVSMATGPPPHPPGPRVLALGLAVGICLAVLTKGLVGILIPGTVGVLFMLFYRDATLLRRARPEWTLAALLVIAAPWFVLVSLRNPGFAQFFFIFEHFQRYLTTRGFDRYQPAWFFLPVLIAGVLPWLSLLPRALRQAVRAAPTEPATGLLLIWTLFIFVFFSASHSKLVPYVLPLMPALSLLLGRSLAQLPARRLAAHLAGMAGLAALLMAALGLILWLGSSGVRAPALWLHAASAGSLRLFIAALLALGLGATLGVFCSRRGHALAAAASAGFGCLLFAPVASLATAELPGMQAKIQLIEQLAPRIAAYRHFYCVAVYVQTVPYYLHRTCTLVAYRGELDFGLRLQPALGIASFEPFVAAWRRDSSALALLRPADYPRLVALGAPMRVIYTSPSFMAVVRQ
ncbi:MAG TPA: glycosyltransferase family 39 protein [Steroidobacteraceae bacterium]|jgi:4-amino-4-deoxy-L-arabinose transferase-like glycosyltransferase|nr:glycosyltransferase family 39 protein [Steroidobacteraceae bacterium]